ncbi:MAG TPA: ATP-binding protein [Patescibacteria group bacterium]|nr:ATP-binding protein [Patescibacteria group bacterium]
MMTALFAFTTVLALAAAAYFFMRERKLRGSLSHNEEEAKKREASQAQVIHTTKLASLGQMVAGVAHEINTPLGFVKSNVEVVSDLLSEYEAAVTKVMTGVDLLLTLDASMVDRAKAAIQKARIELAKATTLNEARELLEDSATGLKQMSGLVLNLKGFARVDRDGMDTIDLNDSIRSALTIAGHQLRDRITVVEELGEIPKVKCMPSQINQVFLNMITNASQAMDDEGTLTIRSVAKPNFVEVSFEDTGSGIPDDVLPKIFDPFFTTKPVGEGTGLGLSIVHKIIQGHGGAIRVKSQVGKGTTFFVELPLAQKPAAKAA